MKNMRRGSARRSSRRRSSRSPRPSSPVQEEDNIRYIEDYLFRIKDKLHGIVSGSSSSDIDHAFENLRYVQEYLDKLKSLNPQNDPGKTMVYYYPDYISKFREFTEIYLKQMKDAQVKADESRLSERCVEADRNLRYVLQGFVEKKDPAGLYKIPDEAEKIGRTHGDELKKMQELHYEMDQVEGLRAELLRHAWPLVGRRNPRAAPPAPIDIWDKWSRRAWRTRS